MRTAASFVAGNIKLRVLSSEVSMINIASRSSLLRDMLKGQRALEKKARECMLRSSACLNVVTARHGQFQ